MHLFTSIVDMIRQCATNWSTHFLSKAGKLTILLSVLTGIPSFTMTCFELPVSLCKRIQSALTRFWWDPTYEKKGMCWVSWDNLAKPKALGGIGMHDLQRFNQALLAKLAWRIITVPNCLLVRVLKGKYCHKKKLSRCGVTCYLLSWMEKGSSWQKPPTRQPGEGSGQWSINTSMERLMDLARLKSQTLWTYQ